MRATGVPAQPITEVRGSNVVAMAPAARPVLDYAPVAAPLPVAVPEPLPIAEPAVAPPAKIAPANSATVPDDAQRTVVEALAAAKLSSAADAMTDATWTITDGAATIQTELSKIMLATVINAEADKIVRNTLRAAGIPKVTLLPGAADPATPKKPKSARSGTAHAKALEHPMVQAAQKLFSAEIQTVIDLRED